MVMQIKTSEIMLFDHVIKGQKNRTEKGEQTCHVAPPGDMVMERMNFWLNLPLPLPAEVMPSLPFIRRDFCSRTCEMHLVINFMLPLPEIIR